jgi:hypothetical protein
VKKTLLLLTVSAVVILLLSPAATAQNYTGDKGNTASPTATTTPTADATASPSATATATASQLPQTGYLKRTGGPSLATPLALVALVMVGSGVAARALLRRYTSS